jgi:xanthine dehydrogenase small subunit
MARDAICFLRRGRRVEIRDAAPTATLLDWLRLEERSRGTKEGCAEGDCGACTVVVVRRRGATLAHEPVNACIALLGQLDGAELITVEDLAEPDAAAGTGLHLVQESMVSHHASQCGFCTPGIVMSLFALYQEGERPLSRAKVNDALAGNLCRCTGYRPIVAAALEACAGPACDRFAAGKGRTLAALAALSDAGEDLFQGSPERFFAAPASQASLLRLLALHPEATILAGATDVGLWVTKGFAEIDKVIWLGRVPGLDLIEETPESLHLGAMVSHAQAMPALARLDPDLGELLRRFGSAQVRASGTVGGNIANGSPIGDLAPALIALGARLELVSQTGTRLIPLQEFFLAYRRQDRRPGEIIQRLLIPKPAQGEQLRVYKISKRFDEDISAVMAAFRLSVAQDRIVGAHVAYGGMAGIPKRAFALEQALAGLSLSPGEARAWQAAGEALEQDFQPLDDHRASARYRLRVAKNLVLKALTEIAGTPSTATRVAGHREPQDAAR